MSPTATSWWSRLSASTRAMLITVTALLVVLAVAVGVAYANRPQPVALSSAGIADTVVAENSHRLDDAGANAPVLVEFLDFECEACGALYPTIEQFRENYAGDLTYVVRYFPLDGHLNSMNAALAVEAAAEQGEFEAMYRKMFETQAEWGEQQTSEAPRFRDFAAELGLDLEAYDAAIVDPATEARIQEDIAAGEALGVRGTPTFFLDGQQLNPQTLSDLTDPIEAAILAAHQAQ